MKKINLNIDDINYYDYYPYGKNFLFLEEGDNWAEAYEKGYQVIFIKESQSERPILYLNRGIRIDLARFEMSSENRRIMRKTEYLDYEVKAISDFEYDPISVGKQSLAWFKNRFPEVPMHISRIKRIYTAGLNNSIFIYKDMTKQGKIIGYATAINRDNIVHYTYPFYDQEYFKMNLGIGMMLRAVMWAKENQKEYIYLGTCNNQAALYKLQFKGVEWFDGGAWSRDLSKLKDILRNKSKGKG